MRKASPVPLRWRCHSAMARQAVRLPRRGEHPRRAVLLSQQPGHRREGQLLRQQAGPLLQLAGDQHAPVRRQEGVPWRHMHVRSGVDADLPAQVHGAGAAAPPAAARTRPPPPHPAPGDAGSEPPPARPAPLAARTAAARCCPRSATVVSSSSSGTFGRRGTAAGRSMQARAGICPSSPS